MNIDNLPLGELQAISSLVKGADQPTLTNPNGALRIVILQRGWIVVGRVHLEGAEYKIVNASVIRVWGTKSGLGEIALGGPTKDTILDVAGTVRVHSLAVVAQIECEETKWK